MTNNLKGAGRRGFIGFRITLSLVFFPCISSSVTIGFHRSPTRTGYHKEGDVVDRPVTISTLFPRWYNTIISLSIHILVLSSLRINDCIPLGTGYLTTTVYGNMID